MARTSRGLAGRWNLIEDWPWLRLEYENGRMTPVPVQLGVNASGKVATAIGGLSETAAGTVAGVIGAVKLVGDFGTFAFGGIFKCK